MAASIILRATANARAALEWPIVEATLRQVRAALKAREAAGLAAGLPPMLAREQVIVAVADATAGPLRQAFAALEAQYTASVNAGYIDGSLGAIIAADENRDPWLTWKTTSTGPCPSCQDRHGRRERLRVWRRIGMPGTLWPDGEHPECSLVVRRCKCRFIPGDQDAGDILRRARGADGRTRRAA